MRDYGKIHVSFWTSATTRSLSDDGKILALYLLTTGHGNMIGAYRLSVAYVADDLEWGFERVSKGFAELFRNGFATLCERSKWVFLHRFLKWNPIENANQAKCALKLFEAIPDDSNVKRCVAEALAQYAPRYSWPDPKGFRNPSETVSKPFRNQDQDQDQDQEQEQDISASRAADDGEPDVSPSAPAADKRRRSPAKPPHRISATLAAWDRVHAEELGVGYVRTKGAAEAAAVKRLLAATDKGGMTDDDIEAAMRRFHGDPFWAGKGVVEFASHFSEFTRDKPKDPRKALRFTKDDPLFQGMEGFNGFGTNGVEGPRLLEGGVSECDRGDSGNPRGLARRFP